MAVAERPVWAKIQEDLMNVNTKILALMAALAAGVAAAAPTPNTTSTTAGTSISNTATATFTDPATNTDAPAVKSNEVLTTVLALPSFDVVYDDGTADANTLGNTPKTVTGAVPGQVVTTDYDIVNTGNTQLTVTLRANTTGSAAGVLVKYLDASGKALTANADGTYTVTLPTGAGGVVKFIQQLTVPSDAPANATYGASPEAFVTGTGTAAGQNGVPTGSTLYEGQTVSSGAVVTTPAQGADLQFVKVTTFQPSLVGSPNVPNPTNPVTPDGGTAATPPTLVSANVPTVDAGTSNRPNPTNTVTTAYPSTPSNTSDPTSGGTPIVVDAQGNRQVAYPKADNDNNPTTPNAAGQTNSQTGTPDVIIFTNDLKNNGTSADTAQLFPAGPDGMLLSGTTFNATTGVFTLPNGVQVRFLGPTTGSPIPVGSGATYPTVTVPAGSTVIYRTEVTLPDADDSSRIDPISVLVGADSLKDADTKADTLSTDTVNSAAAQFGDSTDGVLGATPTPAPTQVVVPGANTTLNIATANTADNVAVFPMDVANMGAYNDSFTLSATVAGLPAGATITYVDASGAALPLNGAGNYVTPVVAAGNEIKVYAVVTVPDGTAAGTYTVSQKVVGNYSTLTMTDLNDVVQVGAVGNVAVAKFTQDGSTAAGATPQQGLNNPAGYTADTTTALPGSNIVYRIIGKNNYNSPVANFALNDTVPANTTFQAASLTVNGASVSKVIYKIGTGTWSMTAPTVGAVAGTAIAVAADANGDNVPDALAAGSIMELTFTVKVN
ncbi:beta strand repeat-containing protein [Deinococcus petrolearius]|uniref:Beta strand repeat-containing protein n=1 Tax=Deinococcus petrolearius TaxID=1751295 RepID=A0ABW1DNQ3_9DEIO